MTVQAFNISENISKELFEKVVEVFNKCPDSLVIYINSSGGSTRYTEAILDLISRNKYRTCIVGYGSLFSSAFELFFRADCEKTLLPGTVGMYHQSVHQIDINEFGNPMYAEGVAVIKHMKTFNRNVTKEVCGWLQMTDLEKNKIKKGNDVYFQYERMLEFLTIINNQKQKFT